MQYRVSFFPSTIANYRAQSNFSGVSRDLSLEFGLGLNDQKRSGQGTSVWDLKEGKRQLQSILRNQDRIR